MVCAGTFYARFSAHQGSTGGFLLLQYSNGVLWQGSPNVSTHCFYCFYLLPVMIHRWVRPSQGPNKCFYHYGSWGRGLESHKASSRGGGGGWLPIVWMCMPNAPLFQRCQVYDWPLFFQQKVYDWPHFSGLVYERPHFSDVSRYMHIFFVQRLLVLLVFNELTAIFV